MADIPEKRGGDQKPFSMRVGKRNDLPESQPKQESTVPLFGKHPDTGYVGREARIGISKRGDDKGTGIV